VLHHVLPRRVSTLPPPSGPPLVPNVHFPLFPSLPLLLLRRSPSSPSPSPRLPRLPGQGVPLFRRRRTFQAYEEADDLPTFVLPPSLPPLFRPNHPSFLPPRMLSPLSPQPSLPSPTFTPLPSPSPSSRGQRVRTSSRRNKSVSVSLARAFLSLGVAGGQAALEDSTGGSDSSGGFSRSGTGYGDGSVGGGEGSGGSSNRSRRTKRRHLELSEGDTIQIGQPIPTTSSSAPLKVVRPDPSILPPPPTTTSSTSSSSTESEPGLNRLEIVRQLGTGSYAVVYLVREVLDQPTGRKRSDSGSELEWDMEGEDGIVGLGTGAGKGRSYGREFGESSSLLSPPPSFLSGVVGAKHFLISSLSPCFRNTALKCLSKQDLSEESLEVQMFEVRPPSLDLLVAPSLPSANPTPKKPTDNVVPSLHLHSSSSSSSPPSRCCIFSPGHHPSIPTSPSKHRHSLPNAANPRMALPRPRTLPRRGPLLLARTFKTSYRYFFQLFRHEHHRRFSFQRNDDSSFPSPFRSQPSPRIRSSHVPLPLLSQPIPRSLHRTSTRTPYSIFIPPPLLDQHHRFHTSHSLPPLGHPSSSPPRSSSSEADLEHVRSDVRCRPGLPRLGSLPSRYQAGEHHRHGGEELVEGTRKGRLQVDGLWTRDHRDGLRGCRVWKST